MILALAHFVTVTVYLVAICTVVGLSFRRRKPHVRLRLAIVCAAAASLSLAISLVRDDRFNTAVDGVKVVMALVIAYYTSQLINLQKAAAPPVAVPKPAPVAPAGLAGDDRAWFDEHMRIANGQQPEGER